MFLWIKGESQQFLCDTVLNVVLYVERFVVFNVSLPDLETSDRHTVTHPRTENIHVSDFLSPESR